MGYDMPVGERGDGLSGGQKQCISIARAFIYSSLIILLDEPTNSMDSARESNFVKTIKTHKENCTMLLISHKNILLSLTQRLILMDNGKIILDGARADVIKQLHTPKKGVANES